MRKLFIALMVLCLALALVACTQSTPQATTQASKAPTTVQPTAAGSSVDLGVDKIKVGYFGVLTGDTSATGIPAAQGARLKTELINNAGGIYGKQLELIEYDDKALPENAVKAVTRLLTVDKVHVICGTQMSANLAAVGGQIDEAKVPTMGNGISASWLQKGFKFLFRPFSSATSSMPALVKTMADNGVKKVALINTSEEFQKDNSAAVVKELPNQSLEMTIHEIFQPGDKDWTGQLTKMIGSSPDAIVILSQAQDVAPLIKQAKQIGYKGYFYGDTNFSIQDVRDVGGDAVNGSIFASAYYMPQDPKDASDPDMKSFLESYIKKYGAAPPIETACRTWDSMSVLQKAITDAKSLDGQKVRDTIASLKGFKALSGTLNFADFDNGESQKYGQLYIIHQGKILLLEDFYKANGKDVYKLAK